MEKNDDSSVKENVKEYYGKVLSKKDDLKTNACCSIEVLPDYLMEVYEIFSSFENVFNFLMNNIKLNF